MGAMSQTTLSVVAEVVPASAPALRSLIAGFRAAEEATATQYDRLKFAVPALHFMSVTVVEDAQYDPALVVECNFDGASGPFFAQLEAAFGELIRDMLRCCKPPAEAALFAAVTAAGSRLPVAPLLEALVVTPAVFHHGNRGLDRARIATEAEIFAALRAELDGPGGYRRLDEAGVHARLRDVLRPRFPTLQAEPPPLVSAAENRADWVRLVGFVLVVVAGLMLPGAALALLLPLWLVGVALAVVLLWAGGRLRGIDPEWATGGTLWHWLVRLVAVAAALDVVAAALPWRWAALLLAGLSGIPAVFGCVLLWLRLLERRDPSLDAPVQDLASLRALAESEDQISQNHMISIVHIKPGILRAVLLRAGLWGLGYVLRVVARDGYLGSMRTIHFAHWGIVGGGGRLMFHSNFDGTWESYLDDFIEKAHAGLTLAWSCGAGFPPVRYLALLGATQGRRFKAWARHSMTPSQFWFSAYPGLSVNQIDRQRRIADGLRRARLTPQELDAWALDL